MTEKSPLQKIQDTVIDTVKGVVKDPAGAAGKAAEQAKGALALGKMVAGSVAKTATDRVSGASSRKPAPVVTPPREVPAAEPEKTADVTPIDVARVVAKKAPAKKAPAKKAPARKAPAKKATTPSAKLPAKKAPAKKAPAKKTPAKKATPKPEQG
ncbi:hypothetical protein [Nocardioides sp. SR21]|uniref:hypothetical protein n=1 Tax=Nocardioides sp. SR21 TaxID=2919501 RepID=UPI001FAA7E8C|nr:hypothetical protein [Nocardioides sp. SR21]